MNKVPLKLAIYFSNFNQWVLLDPSSLIQQSKRYVTTFLNSIAKNEMGTFGDILIGTKSPLEFIIINDIDKTSPISDDGQTVITIKDIKLKCGGVELKEELNKNIAFYFIRNGNWIESSVTPIVNNNKVESIIFTFEPERPSDNDSFDTIGYLSSMISAAYRERTISNDKVVAIDANVDPAQYNIGIPDNYKSDELPLWIFHTKPNLKEEIQNITMQPVS